MKRILVPTDFTPSAINAFGYAYDLAAKVNGHIILLHTYELPFFLFAKEDISAQDYIERATRNYIGKMHNIVKEVSSKIDVNDNGNVTFEYIVTDGSVVPNILKYQQEKDCDLIVMGTHGAGGIKQYFAGSNSVKVMEHTKCPVFIVPDGARYKHIEKILYPTAIDQHNFKEMEGLVEFARLFDAEVTFLYVDQKLFSDIADRYLLDKAIRDNFKYDNISRSVIEDNDVEDGINKYIQNYDVDVVALLRRERPLLNSLFHVSITRKMTHHTHLPLLIYHEHS